MSYDYEKKTTNTGKNQNFFRKMGEESVEAIYTIFFSQKVLSMILRTSSLKEDEAINIRMT